ncbi:hypothetical protein ATO46_06435 [Aeromonas schubertii]|uniref:type IV pilus assembly protein FimV n=1 Tax=Aeromonas schubertii TaxID=652 RepID=UPI00067E8C87|nr:hypothetical protein [Aeromonas schubertii]KUE78943.1 hypothetical protein ATO46_06435 [Aeromonas schubertii]
MLLGWLALVSVNVSGYMPLAEQTWVSLDPAWYPTSRPLPQIFAAWHGNQFPVLETEQRHGRWQLLFPARLKPPFTLFEGAPQLSRVYQMRLRRIDEMAYGVSVRPGVTPAPASQIEMLPAQRVPLIREWAGWQEPWHPKTAHTLREVEQAPAIDPSPLPQGVCHRVGAGETLWRIADNLARERGSDTYTLVLALHAENRARLGPRGQVRSGSELRCPGPDHLQRYQAMTAAQRQAAVIALQR